MSEAEVVKWADDVIASTEISTWAPWLISLSTSGIVACMNDQDANLPPPETLSFKQRFALRAVKVDLECPNSLLSFSRWACVEGIGENLSDPAVPLAYQLDHAYDLFVAMDIAREGILTLLQECQELNSHLLGLGA